MEQYKVSLATLIKDLSVEQVYIPEGEKGNAEKIFIVSTEINRPALQLADYYDHFDPKRIQILGKEEASYISMMCAEKRRIVIDRLFATGIPVGIWTVARRASIPPKFPEQTGIPITGIVVLAAIAPAR